MGVAHAGPAASGHGAARPALRRARPGTRGSAVSRRARDRPGQRHRRLPLHAPLPRGVRAGRRARAGGHARRARDRRRCAVRLFAEHRQGAGQRFDKGRHPAFAIRHDRDHRDVAAQRRAPGDRRDQRQGRSAGEEDRPRRGGSAVPGAGLRRESEETSARGQGGRGARLLHISQPAIGPAGLRGI